VRDFVNAFNEEKTTMQMEQTTQLRHVWKARGNPACQHPHYEQEYFLSSGTGDYVCTRAERMSIRVN
jgi:hypothetical protein